MAEMDDVEAVAIELWHRYAPSHHMGWADEPAKEEYRDAARAAIAALKERGWQKVEEGMCVVPVEPTEAVLSAMARNNQQWLSDPGPYARSRRVYRAMLTASRSASERKE